eukprot:jgi/Bigna1/81130/fgenesh1_pg.77_\
MAETTRMTLKSKIFESLQRRREYQTKLSRGIRELARLSISSQIEIQSLDRLRCSLNYIVYLSQPPLPKDLDNDLETIREKVWREEQAALGEDPDEPIPPIDGTLARQQWRQNKKVEEVLDRINRNRRSSFLADVDRAFEEDPVQGDQEYDVESRIATEFTAAAANNEMMVEEGEGGGGRRGKSRRRRGIRRKELQRDDDDSQYHSATSKNAAEGGSGGRGGGRGGARDGGEEIEGGSSDEEEGQRKEDDDGSPGTATTVTTTSSDAEDDRLRRRGQFLHSDDDDDDDDDYGDDDDDSRDEDGASKGKEGDRPSYKAYYNLPESGKEAISEAKSRGGQKREKGEDMMDLVKRFIRRCIARKNNICYFLHIVGKSQALLCFLCPHFKDFDFARFCSILPLRANLLHRHVCGAYTQFSNDTGGEAHIPRFREHSPPKLTKEAASLAKLFDAPVIQLDTSEDNDMGELDSDTRKAFEAEGGAIDFSSLSPEKGKLPSAETVQEMCVPVRDIVNEAKENIFSVYQNPPTEREIQRVIGLFLQCRCEGVMKNRNDEFHLWARPKIMYDSLSQ